MIRFILASLLTIVLINPLSAQELVSRRVQADRLFDRYEYYKSLQLYLKLAESNKPEISVIERVADCYRLMNRYDDAEQWYARATSNRGAKPIDAYYYAEILLRNKKFDKAREQYRKYFAANGTKPQRDLKLGTCDSAELWMKQDGHYEVTNEKKINSLYADWGPCYQGKTGIIFTSDRSTPDYKGDKGIYARTGNEWLKLFTYDLESTDTYEMKFYQTGDINLTKDYHTGPLALSATGDTAYITITTRLSRGHLPEYKTKSDQRVYTRRLELIMAIKTGGKWGKFVRFPYNNVRSYSVGHAALSKNGNLLYFTSDMPGGMGGTDIWYCEKMSNGKWGKPVNCGKNINTSGDEAFPSIGGDDKLYYSSKGLPGMGGYDIFSAKGSGAIWGAPVNLKYPVNSTSDDFCFVTIDGKTGYLSSDRQGGQGSDDIYSFVYNGTNAPVKKTETPKPVEPPMAQATPAIVPPQVTAKPVTTVPPLTMITLEAVIFNNKTNQNLDSVTVILKNAQGITIDGDLVLTGKKFSFNIPKGQDYTIEARKKNFYPVTQRVSTTVNVPSTGIIQLRLNMEPLEVGKTFVLRNIYYDLNRASIRKDAMVELDKLVAIMTENPTMRIELSSHTDSRGSDYYNMLLSQARAVSAVAYMKRRGIAADRMEAKGYGETRLLNKCGNGVPCTEEEHQENRRTEIKVIGGTFK